jgi:hypothetical protein
VFSPISVTTVCMPSMPPMVIGMQIISVEQLSERGA